MSKLPSFETKLASSAGSVDTDILAVFQDAGKKATAPKGPYSSLVERFRRNKSFDGGVKSTQFVRFGGKSGADNVLFFGMGQPQSSGPGIPEENARLGGALAWKRLMAEKASNARVTVDSFSGAKGLKGVSTRDLVRCFAEGMALASYRYGKYKSKKKDEPAGPEKISFVTKDKALKAQLQKILAEVTATAECVALARDWSNEPSNFGTPAYFASQAQKLAKKYGVRCRVMGERELAREKMGLFLGVSQGSDREAKMVVLEYKPKKAAKNAKTIAFVGKGVTFDSGGISIKPSLRMEEMKHDMSGASTLMAATLLAARLGVPNKIITVLGFTENMPNGKATQPGNVQTSRSGKTVEIFNTDAEGRLVLADLLDYVQEFKPDCIIDAATLTGAVVVALGSICAGIMGNDDSLVQSIINAGEGQSERLWHLPAYDEYFEDMKSSVADMKNSVNNGKGGTIRAGIFLKQFIKPGRKWAHLDIAGTAWDLGNIPYHPKSGASGIFVRTLARFASEF